MGFGVGEKAEYRFDEVRLSSPSLSSEELSKLTEYVYDALGRRVAMTDYTGAFARTTRYLYAGDRIIEELDGDNNLRASYSTSVNRLSSCPYEWQPRMGPRFGPPMRG